jgi:hypothetical protein
MFRGSSKHIRFKLMDLLLLGKPMAGHIDVRECKIQFGQNNTRRNNTFSKHQKDSTNIFTQLYKQTIQVYNTFLHKNLTQRYTCLQHFTILYKTLHKQKTFTSLYTKFTILLQYLHNFTQFYKQQKFTKQVQYLTKAHKTLQVSQNYTQLLQNYAKHNSTTLYNKSYTIYFTFYHK